MTDWHVGNHLDALGPATGATVGRPTLRHGEPLAESARSPCIVGFPMHSEIHARPIQPQADAPWSAGRSEPERSRPVPGVDDPISNPADGNAPEAPGDSPLVEDDLLIEEISIDGMCGVY